MTALAPVLQGYFAQRLTQRRASRHTVAAYRDTFTLLLRFAHQRVRTPPASLDLADLDATLIGAFLDDLETSRGNSIATRNLRLTAIHSGFSYAALRCPEHAAVIQQVLAIPTKRPDRTTISSLTRTETDALLASPDPTTPRGRRDHLLLLIAVETGLRVSQLTALTCGDTTPGPAAVVHCHGKGRKDRSTPLTRDHRPSAARLDPRADAMPASARCTSPIRASRRPGRTSLPASPPTRVTPSWRTPLAADPAALAPLRRLRAQHHCGGCDDERCAVELPRPGHRRGPPPARGRLRPQ